MEVQVDRCVKLLGADGVWAALAGHCSWQQTWGKPCWPSDLLEGACARCSRWHLSASVYSRSGTKRDTHRHTVRGAAQKPAPLLSQSLPLQSVALR